MKCYIKKLYKKAPNILYIQVQNFNISDIFYKIQNLKKGKMKAVVLFLSRNLKLHSPWISIFEKYLFNFIQFSDTFSSVTLHLPIQFIDTSSTSGLLVAGVCFFLTTKYNLPLIKNDCYNSCAQSWMEFIVICALSLRAYT